MAARSSSLDCSICCERFSDAPHRLPRILPGCGHNFCHACVGQLLAAASPSCPLCRRAIDVPGRDCCHPNYSLIELLQLDNPRPADHRPPSSKAKRPKCRLHPDYRLDLVCLDPRCGSAPLCLLCERKAHSGHRTVLLEEVADSATALPEQAAQLQRVAETLAASSQAASALMLHIEQVSRSIRDTSASKSPSAGADADTSEQRAVHAVRQAFDAYRSRLASAEQRLLADIDAAATRKIELLDQQHAEVGRFLSQAHRLSAHVARLLDDNQSLAADLADLHAEIDQLANVQLHLTPRADPAITFSPPADVVESFFSSLAIAAAHDAPQRRQRLFTARSGEAFKSLVLLGGDKQPPPAVYALDADQWSTPADVPQLPVCRSRLAASRLANGDILVTGGTDPSNETASNETFTYSASEPAWRSAPPMLQTRQFHSQTTLLNGQVLVVGGQQKLSTALATVELFDADSQSWRPAAPLPEPRCTHTAVLLPSGDVLIAGGYSGSEFCSSALIYSAASNAWRRAAPMSIPREVAAGCLLPDGTALVTGGFYKNREQSLCEVYDEKSDTWRAVKEMNQPRAIHSATLVNGRVIVAGGHPKIRTVEVYTPATDTWSLLPSMPTHRWGFAAVPFERVIPQ